MKKWRLYLLLLLSIQSTAIFAEECDDPDAPEQVRIYFANGMNNLSEEIESSRKQLRDLIGNTSTHNFGKSINTKESFFRQLLEVYAQRESEPSRLWEWLADISIAPQWFKDAFSLHTDLVSGISYAQDAELRIMVAEYLQDLNSGKKVVIVSHSQGNFYANTAYQYIKNNFPQYQNNIGIVAVGTPSSRVQDGGPHTTNLQDTIVNLVRLRYSVLPANINYNDPNDHLNHNFITTYLNAAGGKIRSDVLNTINRLTAPTIHADCETADNVSVAVSVRPVSSITDTTATYNGYVSSGKDIDLWFYTDTEIPPICTAISSSEDGVGEFNTGDDAYFNKTGLPPGTNIYVRFCGKGTNNRVSDGGFVQFTTTSSSAQVSNLGAVSIGETTATLRGQIVYGTGVDVWFRWGLSTSSLICNGSGFDGTGIYSAGTTVSLSISGLSIDSVYKYKVCAKGSDGITNSSEESEFHTHGQSEITTLLAHSIYSNKATVEGELTAGQNSKVWVSYLSSSTVPQSCAETWPYFQFIGNEYDAPSSFNILLENLYSNTKYYYRYCAYNGIGDFSDGGTKAFWTL